MEISDQIINIINVLSSKLGVSVDWTQQNIIPQIQNFMMRYIKYQKGISMFFIVIGLALVVVGICLIRYNYKISQSNYGYAEEGLEVLSILSIILGVIILVIFIFKMIKLNTIPEIYFIEYVKTLLLN